MDKQQYSPQTIISFLTEALAAGGIPANDASVVGELMVEADLLGGDGHGLFRLPRYMARLTAGGFNTNPDIRIERQRGAMALLNGDNAMGHLVMNRAVDLAIQLGKENGVGWVGAHHSNHAGAAGVYALKLAEQDMIGMYLAVGNANHMAPWGGSELLLSTNPIAVAVPSDDGPILLDMATTQVAYGKVKLAAQRGETMPEGWMIDRFGHSLTDPQQAAGGSLLPIGGPKGYGLSLIFGILAGTLNTAAMGRDVVDFNADNESVTNTGQAILALNIEDFCDLSWFKARISALREELKSSALRPGFDEIRLPGERALTTREKRRADGIPVSAAMMAELDAIATGLGIIPLSHR